MFCADVRISAISLVQLPSPTIRQLFHDLVRVECHTGPMVRISYDLIKRTPGSPGAGFPGDPVQPLVRQALHVFPVPDPFGFLLSFRGKPVTIATNLIYFLARRKRYYWNFTPMIFR